MGFCDTTLDCHLDTMARSKECVLELECDVDRRPSGADATKRVRVCDRGFGLEVIA